MYSCPHTGVALATLFKLVERGDVGPSDRVVVLSTAHGLKFTDFKIGYHENTLSEVSARYANLPLEVEADLEEISRVIDQMSEA
jgi:threonine synthase